MALANSQRPSARQSRCASRKERPAKGQRRVPPASGVRLTIPVLGTSCREPRRTVAVAALTVPRQLRGPSGQNPRAPLRFTFWLHSGRRNRHKRGIHRPPLAPRAPCQRRNLLDSPDVQNPPQNPWGGRGHGGPYASRGAQIPPSALLLLYSRSSSRSSRVPLTSGSFRRGCRRGIIPHRDGGTCQGRRGGEEARRGARRRMHRAGTRRMPLQRGRMDQRYRPAVRGRRN